MSVTIVRRRRRRRRPKPNRPANRTSKWITPERRAAIYKRDGMRCVYCNEKAPVTRVPSPTGVVSGLALDHVVSREEGGGNETGNLVTVCPSCNRDKSKAPLDEWTASMPATERKRVHASIDRATSRPIDLEAGKAFVGPKAARPCR